MLAAGIILGKRCVAAETGPSSPGGREVDSEFIMACLMSDSYDAVYD